MPMSKRFQTYFGVPIPPWKEDKIGAGSTTIRFVLTGKVPSKKNNQMAVAVRKHARDWLKQEFARKGVITLADAQKAVSMVRAKVRGNQAYYDFLEKIKPVIHEQMGIWSGRLRDKGLIFPISSAAMSLRLYFKDRYVTDTVNKQQTIQDVLQACGVICNDDYDTINPIHSASACFYEEIIYNIAFVSLSFKL
jgi:hypothetical protein